MFFKNIATNNLQFEILIIMHLHKVDIKICIHPLNLSIQLASYLLTIM